jgi:hypothetical protein
VRDQSGSYAILVALLAPVLIGFAGLGTEAAWWYFKHKGTSKNSSFWQPVRVFCLSA